MKVIMEKLNGEFKIGTELKTAIPTDEKEEHRLKSKIDAYANDMHACSSIYTKSEKNINGW